MAAGIETVDAMLPEQPSLESLRPPQQEMRGQCYATLISENRPDPHYRQRNHWLPGSLLVRPRGLSGSQNRGL